MSGHDHHHGTGKALAVTVTVNLALTALKWTAFLFTGSPSLFGEAAHSSADALNPIVLWIGRRRAARPAHDRHPYGHGKETFFWSLIAAQLMLLVGAALTAWHGIETLMSGRQPDQSRIALGILSAAILAEGYSFIRTWRELKRRRGAAGRIGASSDPVLLAIIFENGADVLAVACALAGFGLYTLTGDARWDAGFSLAIAAILAASSFFLINRNRSLIIGEAAPPETAEKIAALIRTRPSVAEVASVTAVMDGPERVAVRAAIRWNEAWFNERWYGMPDACSFHPKRSFWLLSLVSSETATIKAVVQRAMPEVDTVDITVLTD
jgi:cation diffusion facilitator family transporter